ncbi:DUF3012 domain-containing protein [Zhongshania sp.]|uniref:DUF3012 domain-containing protein n=1 Tax=Zhongshania sp. TaxID=1971902 RepID=UPI0035660858
MKKTITGITLLLSVALLAACAPEVGSDAWCVAMDKKAKGDWSANEAKDYAKHCVFK